VRARVADGQLPSLDNAGDMLLAFACTQKLPSALALFQALFVPVLQRVLSRRGAELDLAQEVQQIVLERLLVGPAGGGAAKIAEYRGHGPLKSWVSTTCATTLSMLRRSTERRREDPVESQLYAAVTHADPELSQLAERYTDQVHDAIVSALKRLSDRERVLIRLQVGEGMSIDQLSVIYAVNRATAARWLVRARESVLEFARAEMKAQLGLSESECDSLLRLVRSGLDVSILRHLG
jgi:RNA polymerase sigma-70 factor